MKKLMQEMRFTSLRVQKQRKGRKNSLSAWLFVAAKTQHEHVKCFRGSCYGKQYKVASNISDI